MIAGAIFACLISLGFFLFHQFLVGALFFLFAFQSFDAWQKTRLFSETDRNAAVKKSLIEAEELLQAGKKKEAKVAFEKVRFEAKQGLIFNMATQYQAFLEYEEGDVKKTYELLKSAQSDLAPDGLCLLHKAAFEEKDYILVVKLASECFQNIPSVDTALRNAYAHAELKQAQAAIGWLETAVREGLQNFKDILSYSSFDLIRADPIFLKWIEDHKTST
ncbi:MAG: hypothetical protein EBZ47_01400 [Chlamydiae bacterium]|nr:hypothetical protein [Chlamydiota bacterium]